MENNVDENEEQPKLLRKNKHISNKEVLLTSIIIK